MRWQDFVDLHGEPVECGAADLETSQSEVVTR